MMKRAASPPIDNSEFALNNISQLDLSRSREYTKNFSLVAMIYGAWGFYFILSVCERMKNFYCFGKSHFRRHIGRKGKSSL